MTRPAWWCLAYKMSMRLSCDLACARKIINLFIINANDSNCKETQTFPYCTGSTPHNASREIISILSLGTKYQLWLQFFTITVGMVWRWSMIYDTHNWYFHCAKWSFCQSNDPNHLSLYVLSSLDPHKEPSQPIRLLWECGEERETPADILSAQTSEVNQKPEFNFLIFLKSLC